MRATIANTAAQRVAAAEAVRAATAEFAAARAEQQRAAAHLAATSAVVQGSAARAAAADAMAAANARAVLAEKGLQAAMAASAAVAKTTSIAMRGLQTVMGFLGGPVGVVLLAATALYQFATSAREAKDPTDLLTQSVDALGNAQLRLQKIKLTEAIAEQDKLAKGSMWTQYKVNALKKDIAEAPEGSNAWKGYTKQLTEIEAESEGAREMSAKLQEQLAKVNAEIGKRSGEKQVVNTPKRKEDPEDAKVRQRLQDELELAKLSGEAKARQAALQKLSANATDEERQKVSDLAAEVWRLDEAKKATTKTDKEGAALAKKKTAEEKKGAEENKQAIIDYAIEIGKLADKTQDYSEASALAKLNKFATPEDVRVMRELAAAQAQIIEAEKNKALLGQLDPMAGEDQRFTKQLEDLKKLNDAKLLEDERYLELKGIAERQHLETVRQLQEENFKAASLGNEILMNSIDAMASGATGALSGILSGTMSLQEALGNLANTVLNSVIGAFVQAGVDFVKQEIIKRAAIQATQTTQQASMAAVAATQAGTTAAMAATTTTTAATTGASVAGSMAPAAGLSSIASFGGAAVIGGAALLATMALAKSFGGGRRYGGDVNSDSFYRINESGPEIFTANDGKQYMTGANGHVTSNADAFNNGGGSRPVQVIIEDYRGNGADPQVSQETLTDRDVIRIVLNDMQSGGQLARATNQITGTKRPGG
ncbi:tape measure protein [Pseudomonas phage DDSR119]|nr:tape measure protein [Pseudomonas phage DDSR119]